MREVAFSDDLLSCTVFSDSSNVFLYSGSNPVLFDLLRYKKGMLLFVNIPKKLDLHLR